MDEPTRLYGDKQRIQEDYRVQDEQGVIPATDLAFKKLGPLVQHAITGEGV